MPRYFFHVDDGRDMPDRASFWRRDCDVLALTDCTLAYVEHRDLLAQPRLALDL